MIGWPGFGNFIHLPKIKECDSLCPKMKFEEILSSLVPDDEELAKLKME